jgi:hypothetical protein
MLLTHPYPPYSIKQQKEAQQTNTLEQRNRTSNPNLQCRTVIINNVSHRQQILHQMQELSLG